MSLLRYWPTAADCLACIKPEAENPSDAVFLAVHQEMRFVRRSFQTDQAEKRTQRQLLNEFLRDDPSGRVILPILGESGIGKSHLVRWLDVQLRQRDDRGTRHVIRIPKSSSLKSVLRRILDGLEGPRYETIRIKLQSARDQMDEIGAKQRIRAELLAAIQRKYETAVERKATARRDGKSLSPEDTLWEGHGEPRALPALLSDPATQILFMQGTEDRPGLISELARHITKDTSESDSPRRQFEKADFIVPDELADNIKEAGAIAGKYLQKLDRVGNQKSLEEVVKLLNGIVDDAISPLATPADTSLSELFYDVRRELLADGRELVLLVEDFAVLAGIQKALLDAIIREGESGGKSEACMIRTALAVTDGYFEGLETVKTRAVHGWRIEAIEGDDDDTTVDRIGNFVAAYVNAARIGAPNLELHYSDLKNISKPIPQAMAFIEPEDNELELLAAFGLSADQLSLFPFNRPAIRELADWKLRDSEKRMRFHPRSIINEIILPVVKDYRDSFEIHDFPPFEFLGFDKRNISAELDREVSLIESDRQKQLQYLYLFRFWGGDPKRIAEAKIPAGVYQAFGIQTLDPNAKSIKPTSLKETITDGTSDRVRQERIIPPSHNKPSSQEYQEPETIRKFIEILDAWRGGAVLGQKEANQVRTLIKGHILLSIDWEAELLPPLKSGSDNYVRDSIYLPNAKGQGALDDVERTFLLVATNQDFTDAEVANGVFFVIRAMLRHEHYENWAYEGSEHDYAALTNFIDQHLDSATDWIRSHYKNVDGDPVPALTQALLWQAKVLNVEFAHRADDTSLLAAVFQSEIDPGSRDTDEDWNAFLKEMSSKRGLLLDELKDRIIACQGTQKNAKPHAVDATRLIEPIKDLKKSWEITAKFPSLPSSSTDELKQTNAHILSLSRFGTSKVEARCKRIADQSQQILNELGRDYDKNELLRDLNEVCDLSQQQGLTGTVTVPQIKRLIEQFQSAKVKEVSKQVEEITSNNDLGSRMSAIASLDIQTHAFLVDFAAECSMFLRERLGKAESTIIKWSKEVVETKRSEVDAILKDLEEAAATFAGETA